MDLGILSAGAPALFDALVLDLPPAKHMVSSVPVELVPPGGDCPHNHPPILPISLWAGFISKNETSHVHAALVLCIGVLVLCIGE